MRTKALLLILALPALTRAEQPSDPVQAMAGAYRAGRVPEALDRAADVIEADPANREARHYLWTLGRRLKEEEAAAALSEDERRAAVRLAEERLARQRAETEKTLGLLRDSFEKSRRVRSPEDVLAGAEGMGRYLDERFEEERQRALADGYFRGLVENLTTALRNKTFVSRKDQLVAEAWLAYYGGRRGAALKKWEAAAAADPSDKEVANNLDRLRRLMRREEDEKKVIAWETQAATYRETGFYAEALELWEKVLEVQPGRADAQKAAEACRASLSRKQKDAKLAALTEEGVRLYQRGQTIEAAQVWFSVLEQEPSHRQARVWLSYAGKQLKASDPAPAPRADPRDPKSTEYTDQDRVAALELYKKGLIVYAQDQVSEAVDFWRKALDRYPGLTQAQQALRQAQAEMSFKKSAGK